MREEQRLLFSQLKDSWFRQKVKNIEDYCITDGERYIYRNNQGKYVPGHNISMADLFTKEQANSILHNQLPKMFRNTFWVEQCCDKKSDKNLNVVIEDSISHWLSKIMELNNVIKEAYEQKKRLSRELSTIDKEICDVLHYIEFSNLNAAQGYAAYRMIKERRIKRRKIKNEIIIVDLITRKKVSDSLVEDIKKKIISLNNQKYEPRILKGLFM